MIKYSGSFELERATDGSAGFDLRTRRRVTIDPGAQALVGTSMKVAIPKGYVGLLFVRSSLGVLKNLCLANSVGVIDSDYRGEVLVPLRNAGAYPQLLEMGERIAQLVVVPYMGVAQRVDDLDDTARGEGGFGSTGNE